MIAFLKRADHVIFKIQEYICIITSVLITSLIVIAAIMRYILGINFGGSEELVLFARFGFILQEVLLHTVMMRILMQI